MRKPPMTFDAILAALAVLAGGAACSKADRAAAEPPAAAPAATATTTATASAIATAQAAQPSPPAAAAPEDEMKKSAVKVDAGTERTPAPTAKPKGASAACGATGCSAEMRKGGK